MDKLVCDIFQCELFTRSPDVPVFIPISSQISVYGSYEHKTTDIELPFVDEQWLIHVFLYDVAFHSSTFELNFSADYNIIKKKSYRYS